MTEIHSTKAADEEAFSHKEIINKIGASAPDKFHNEDINHCCVIRVLFCVSPKRDFSGSQEQ